jgi:hypothetical protein
VKTKKGIQKGEKKKIVKPATILCKEDVVMENGDNKGEVAFTKGKKYKISLQMSTDYLTLYAINNSGGGHNIFQTRIHPAYAKFVDKYFDLSSLK